MRVIWHTRRFRSLRQKRALELGRRVPIQEVADQSGISWWTIQRWETGNVGEPDPAAVKILAEYYGKTLDYFYSIEDETPGNHKAIPESENAVSIAQPA